MYIYPYGVHLRKTSCMYPYGVSEYNCTAAVGIRIQNFLSAPYIRTGIFQRNLNPLLLLPIKFQLRTSIPPQITHTTMLRRKPTSIILTTEDVATYVDSRRREALGVGENRNPNNDNNPSSATGESGKLDPNDELKPLPGDKARINRVGGGVVGSSREERILGR